MKESFLPPYSLAWVSPNFNSNTHGYHSRGSRQRVERPTLMSTLVLSGCLIGGLASPLSQVVRSGSGLAYPVDKVQCRGTRSSHGSYGSWDSRPTGLSPRSALADNDMISWGRGIVNGFL